MLSIGCGSHGLVEWRRVAADTHPPRLLKVSAMREPCLVAVGTRPVWLGKGIYPPHHSLTLIELMIVGGRKSYGSELGEAPDGQAP